MTKGRVRIGQRRDEPTPPNIFSDFDWLRENRQSIFDQYGKGVALIYNKTVIGFGESIEKAAEDAERRLPPECGEVTPIIGLIHNTHWLETLLLKHAVNDAFRKLREEELKHSDKNN